MSAWPSPSMSATAMAMIARLLYGEKRRTATPRSYTVTRPSADVTRSATPSPVTSPVADVTETRPARLQTSRGAAALEQGALGAEGGRKGRILRGDGDRGAGGKARAGGEREEGRRDGEDSFPHGR